MSLKLGGGYLPLSEEAKAVIVKFLEQRGEMADTITADSRPGEMARALFVNRLFGLNFIPDNSKIGNPAGVCVLTSDTPLDDAVGLQNAYAEAGIQITLHTESEKAQRYAVTIDGKKQSFLFVPGPPPPSSD